MCEATKIEKVMDVYEATMIAGGVHDADDDRQLEAWQYLIDTGVCWTLQGRFGHMATNLIDMGLCEPAQPPISAQPRITK